MVGQSCIDPVVLDLLLITPWGEGQRPKEKIAGKELEKKAG